MDLSVIIPACNTQGWIAACLRSVTRCPADSIEMECLVIDDGSTDDTAAIVKRYIQRDSRIKLITKEKSGAADTRNRGIMEASGEYLLFIDDGDRLCEDAWEQIEAAVSEEHADFMAFSHVAFFVGNKKVKFLARTLPVSGIVSTDEHEAQRLMDTDFVYTICCGMIFKNSIIRNNNITFCEDKPSERGRMFVNEYFGHCESFMMTKAMIVYHRSDEDFGMLERIKQWFKLMFSGT